MALPYTALITVDEFVRATLESFPTTFYTNVADTASATYEALEDCIVDVTEIIERYLNRELIVRPQINRFDQDLLSGGYINLPSALSEAKLVPIFPQYEGDWKLSEEVQDAEGQFQYVAFCRHWPAVQIISVDDDTDKASNVSIVDANDVQGRGRRLQLDPDAQEFFPYRVTTFSGYRRRDQSVSPGSGGSGDPDATEDLTTAVAAAWPSYPSLTAEPPELPASIRRRALNIATFLMREQLIGQIGIERVSKRIEQMTVESRRVQIDYVERQLSFLSSFRYLVP